MTLTLQLGGNPLTMTGVLDILESVDNSSSVISYIGFDVSSQFSADRTAALSMIGCWHDTVICLSVRLSVTSVRCG